MKNKEIIQIAALGALAAALLYYKYLKKNKSDKGTEKKMPRNSLISEGAADDDYLPYSKKKTKNSSSS